MLTLIAYKQPVTRGAISRLTGREASRDLVATARSRAVAEDFL